MAFSAGEQRRSNSTLGFTHRSITLEPNVINVIRLLVWMLMRTRSVHVVHGQGGGGGVACVSVLLAPPPDPESPPPGSAGASALQKTPCHIVSSFLPVVSFQRARLCVVEHESICFSSVHGLKESWDEPGMEMGSTVREHLTEKVWETRTRSCSVKST